jgi:predicted acylesterase/phospholipase RssA
MNDWLGAFALLTCCRFDHCSPVRLELKDADGTIRSAGEETYFDGSIEHDIPIAGLSEMLNCQFFIACQANPHVVPFFFDSKGAVGRPSRWSSGEQAWSWVSTIR